MLFVFAENKKYLDLDPSMLEICSRKQDKIPRIFFFAVYLFVVTPYTCNALKHKQTFKYYNAF